ncbi:Aste57867_14732 [Aphanomyces stellatus]|uniref:Aste57867_14732 protein n=1 Tax=Aphanomyces stellatus TaxID=120398 RepID=A0A485L363_9STRA|nr:hypothetical protein As57867_014677 [Aphanomyces stellatus]VFT91550.1 Aste57867_14732 [Aphanomyces stellatus]
MRHDSFAASQLPTTSQLHQSVEGTSISDTCLLLHFLKRKTPRPLSTRLAHNPSRADQHTMTNAPSSNVYPDSIKKLDLRIDEAPPSARTRLFYARAAAGVGYMLVSATSGVWFVSMLSVNFGNDLWWAGYSISGTEAFLVDVANKILHPSQSAGSNTFDILSPAATMLKTYDAPVSSTLVYPTYARQLILYELTSLEYAVTNLRTLSASWSLRMNTQHCWIDFNQTLEVAHTTARQTRCQTSYKTNAAVYLEATLRNQVWSDFVAFWGGPGKTWTVAIQSPLEQLASGRAWLAQTTAALASTSVSAEVAYWKSFQLTEFKLQWQDRTQAGISESLVVENALGMQHTFAIKSMDNIGGPWSSENLYWQPLNDLWAGWTFNRSMVRGTDNFFGLNVTLNNIEKINGNTNSAGVFSQPSQLFHDSIGPFVSVDVFFVPPPPSLVALSDTVQAIVAQTILPSPSLTSPYKALLTVSTIATPLPPAWQHPEFVFYGGDPMCPWNGGTAFPQQTIDFFDTCSGTPRLAVPLTQPDSLMLAMLLGGPPADISAVCSNTATSTGCIATLTAATTLFQSLNAVAPSVQAIAAVAAAVSAINPSLMQFAKNTTSGAWSVLTQSLVDGTSPSWSFLGYVMLADWAVGRREVLKLDGDAMTLTLISTLQTAQSVPTSGGNRYVERATVVLFYLVAATSAIVVVVALLCLVYAIAVVRLDLVGKNLLFFNRTLCSTWIGRPMSALRGAAAICLLATARVDLVQSGGFSRLALAPRSWVESLVVTGEATWITYVLNDILLILDSDLTARVAPVCSCVVWFVFWILDLTSPTTPTGKIARDCSALNMDFAVTCTTGIIQIGSFSRVCLLAGLQLAIVASVYAIGFCYQRYMTKHAQYGVSKNLLLSGAAQTYLVSLPESSVNTVVLDKVSCVLTGLLPFSFWGKQYTFDMPLWVLFQDIHSTARGLALPGPDLEVNKARQSRRGLLNDVLPTSTPPPASTQSKLSKLHKVLAVGGFLYICASIAGSVSYMTVSAVNLANNFYWESFNSTGTHAFIANWLNEQLALGVDNIDIALDSASVGQFAYFGAKTAQVAAPANFAANLQHTMLNTVTDTIQGLRAMDACATPWISTAYCYVDLGQTWEMAHSAVRQARCASSMTTNGAVYLETMLRNVNGPQWMQCWGAAFDVAIASAIQSSDAGRAWVAAMQTAPVHSSVTAEATVWANAKITRYDTQWQNYKRIGVLNSYVIQNAYGVQYAMTLQSQNGTFRFKQQSSFKMYWALASDLNAVLTNSSGMGGLSLVRNLPNYAFANTTLQAVLTINNTLTSPLSDSYTLLNTQFLGPFGTIDMLYVPVPPSLSTFLVQLLQSLRSTLAASAAAQTSFAAITPMMSSYPLPLAWYNQLAIGYGASPLCPGASRTSGSKLKGPRQYFSFDASCSTGAPTTALLQPTREALVFAALLSNLGAMSSPNNVCPNDPLNSVACVNANPMRTLAFVTTYFPPTAAVDPSAMAALVALVRGMNIQVMVYASLTPTSPMQIWLANIVDPTTDPTFIFYGWQYVFDWALGRREVVAFQSDIGSLTLVSELQIPLAQDVLPWEVTTNIAQYFRGGVLYVTFLMIVVASLAAFYMLLSRGRFQGLNMLELARVGGNVWVGRPFLFLRSITAITLLSTSSLELQFSGSFSTLARITPPIYKTLLAANEVTWLVSVVNDITMVFTGTYTAVYATANGILVWVVAAILSSASPVHPTTTIQKQCSFVAVDLQLVCRSATIAIGQSSRFFTLIGLVLVCNALCFAVTKYIVLRKKAPPASDVHSLLLSSGAKHLFIHDNRTHNGIYYLDRASAAINGMLTMCHEDRMYALDLKLWRFVAITRPSLSEFPPDCEHVDAWRNAVPLTD